MADFRPYLLSYDYHKDRDYTDLYKLLEEDWFAVRVLESTWLAYLNGNVRDIRDAMVDCGDGDESFFVMELVPGAMWATTRIAVAATDWLSENVTPGEDG